MTVKAIRVGQLNAYIARLISADSVLSDIAVVGEVSNFKVHGSGHVFFSLKDDESRIECFLSASAYRRLGFDLAEGEEVVAEGQVNVYEKGGRYSLAVRRLTAAGRGGLAQAFEALKKKLAAKGYFAEERKKPLPVFPLKVAIVTSDSGAAVSDIQKIITSRNSVVSILVFPTLVQGPGAAAMIASRIRLVNAQYRDTDVMIVGRGGGSAEDLWAFNEEAVADAIFESKIPVISAVGHETDFTIADFVADKRAETPSAAAMLAAPDTKELKGDLEAVLSHLRGSIHKIVLQKSMLARANNVGELIVSLKAGVSERETHAVSLHGRMQRAVHAKTGFAADLDRLRGLAGNAVAMKAERSASRFQAQFEKLEALDPLRVLLRGYAIIEDENGRVVGKAGELFSGQGIAARFADGRAKAVIEEVMLDG